jgi:uncharacterized membrane protein
VIGVPFAHVGGIPIEETLGSFGPALLVAFGVAWAKLRARLRRVRSRANAPVADPVSRLQSVYTR